MKTENKKEIRLYLELDENEINYLKDLTQNPIGCSPSDEDENTKKIRYDFFKACYDALNENKNTKGIND